MEWMKRTAVGLVVGALLAGTGAAVYVQRSFATQDGKLVVKGLRQAVQMQRDGADPSPWQHSNRFTRFVAQGVDGNGEYPQEGQRPHRSSAVRDSGSA